MSFLSGNIAFSPFPYTVLCCSFVLCAFVLMQLQLVVVVFAELQEKNTWVSKELSKLCAGPQRGGSRCSSKAEEAVGKGECTARSADAESGNTLTLPLSGRK